MMNKFVVTLLLAMFTQLSLAQEQFVPGYVITLEGDTIQGFLQEEIDQKLSYGINFKENRDDKGVTKYKPKDAMGFGFEYGRVFRRMENESAQKPENIFAKLMMEGPLDFYVWRKEKQPKPDIFLVNSDTEDTVHLIAPVRKGAVKQHGRRYSPKDPRYRELLEKVKGDKTASEDDIRYSEKRIFKNILKYNKDNAVAPVDVYEEKIEYSYDFTVGLPLNYSHGNEFFRAAVYRSKTKPERTKQISYLRGISYQNWNQENRVADERFRYGDTNYKWQFLSIIPVGIRFQGSSRNVQPYMYTGFGLGLLLTSDYVIDDHQITGSTTDFTVTSTLNLGAGLRVKMGRNYFLAEITPSVNAVFLNIGMSF